MSQSAGRASIQGGSLTLLKSALSGAILGGVAPNMPRNYSAATPSTRDDTVAIVPTNGVLNPVLPSKPQWALPKSSILIGSPFLEIVLSPAASGLGTRVSALAGFTNTFNPDAPVNVATNYPTAEYNKNLGDLCVQLLTHLYGNIQLQAYDGLFQAIYRRICQNDVNIEAINASVLGGLPPGGATEAVLIDAFHRGITLRVPLEECFFAKSRDEKWMPEAYAQEGIIAINLQVPGQLISTVTRSISDTAGATNGQIILPTIVSIELKYQEVTVSAAEKENRLKLYRTPDGLVQHWIDLETQVSPIFVGKTTRAAWSATDPDTWITSASRPNLKLGPIKLDSFRKDIAELIITVRRVANTSAATAFPQENALQLTNYSASPMEGDLTPSSLFVYAYGPGGHLGASVPLAAQGFSSIVDVRDIIVSVGNKTIYSQSMSGEYNRTLYRKRYHPGSQIVGQHYCISFAEWPEDCKNCSGHVSPSVSGPLTLELQVADPGPTIAYEVVVYSRCHNLMQHKLGAVVPAAN